METTTGYTAAAEIPGPPARPQFLTVLCILTWVMCGLSFIMTVVGMFGPSDNEKQMEAIEKMRETDPVMADKMEEAISVAQDPAQKTLNMVLGLVAIGLSAFGAWFMWQLRKTGFYIYLAGELLPYLGFAFGGMEALNATGRMFGMESLAYIAIGVMLVFDLVFIIMYAVNLKHMRS